MQEGFCDIPTWDIPAENEVAPAEINTYSDGSLWFGRHLWAGLGTWGVHRPAVQEEALPEPLQGKAWIHDAGNGVTWNGQIMGPALSSTRTEAFGLLAALAAPGPVHVGIDNYGVVKHAGHLLQPKGRRRRAKRKPWGLQDDGDVWEAVANAVHAKGPRAVQVSKVKGHATRQDVEQ